ncbi:MAG TPA: glycosyltransferase family 1 protein, partial [Acidimicrobiia bacterium]|nr:glycosyltransferase family 1 protein [Acidimicrobiia bacterium]
DDELARLLAETPEVPSPDVFTVLAVGTVLPRKNLGVLADAVRAIHEAGGRISLRVVGPVPEPGRPIIERMADLLGPALHVVGYVPLDELAREYRSAHVVCFPSLLEGFGIPILEAMAAGTPVVASDASSLPEVAGDAALLCPADEPRAWREALVRIRDDSELREGLRARGRRRVSDFSWNHTAAVALEALRRAAGRSGGAKRRTALERATARRPRRRYRVPRDLLQPHVRPPAEDDPK